MSNDKVIRQARKFADESRGDGGGSMTKDEFESAYNLPPKEVDFPWVLFIIFIIIDVVDIFAAFSVIGAFIWSMFTFVIVLPFELWYVKQRDEKYSDFKVEGELQLKGINKMKQLNSKAAQMKRLDAKVAELSKAGKTAQAAKLAGNMKKVLPTWLRYTLAITDKIPFIAIIPGNSLLLYLSYHDNKASVRAIQEGLKAMAGNMDFKVTRVAGSNK